MSTASSATAYLGVFLLTASARHSENRRVCLAVLLFLVVCLSAVEAKGRGRNSKKRKASETVTLECIPQVKSLLKHTELLNKTVEKAMAFPTSIDKKVKPCRKQLLAKLSCSTALECQSSFGARLMHFKFHLDQLNVSVKGSSKMRALLAKVSDTLQDLTKNMSSTCRKESSKSTAQQSACDWSKTKIKGGKCLRKAAKNDDEANERAEFLSKHLLENLSRMFRCEESGTRGDANSKRDQTEGDAMRKDDTGKSEKGRNKSNRNSRSEKGKRKGKRRGENSVK